MPVPAVRVSIADQSLVLPPLVNPSRSVYAVTVCDRGPHNRVVEVRDLRTFHRLFGRPDITRTSQTHYIIDKALATGATCFVVRAVPADAAISNVTLSLPSAANVTNVASDSFTFTNNSNIVTTTLPDLPSLQALGIDIGYWIAPAGPAANAATYANEPLYQVVGIQQNAAAGTIDLVLDRPFAGNTSAAPESAFSTATPFAIGSQPGLTTEPTPTTNVADLFTFYANGAGAYYNNIVIRAIRNVDLESAYVDPVTFQPLYPFMFLDITIVRLNPDGTETILEGPWTVSLAPQDPTTNVPFKDLVTGEDLYLPTVINSRSELIRVVENPGATAFLDPNNPAQSEIYRREFATILANGAVVGAQNTGSGGLRLQNGSDGSQYDAFGRLNITPAFEGIIARTYSASVTSIDGSIEKLTDTLYPTYLIDYIVCGGFSPTVITEALRLANTRGDCMLITDTGIVARSVAEDVNQRQNVLTFSSYNAMIYTQYRRIRDVYTGREITISPVYDAIERHLYVDNTYFISEPVANINKGSINTPFIPMYTANAANGEFDTLMQNQLNPTLIEPQGRYFITQLTAYKKLSVLQRAHVVKFLHFLRKRIPPLLKDLLQQKATPNVIDLAKMRVSGFLQPYVVGSSPSDKFATLNSAGVDVVFDQARSQLFVNITIVPIRAIEQISVTIRVQ